MVLGSLIRLPFLAGSLIFMALYLWSREFPNANVSIMGIFTLQVGKGIFGFFFWVFWVFLVFFFGKKPKKTQKSKNVKKGYLTQQVFDTVGVFTYNTITPFPYREQEQRLTATESPTNPYGGSKLPTKPTLMSVFDCIPHQSLSLNQPLWLFPGLLPPVGVPRHRHDDRGVHFGGSVGDFHRALVLFSHHHIPGTRGKGATENAHFHVRLFAHHPNLPIPIPTPSSSPQCNHSQLCVFGPLTFPARVGFTAI